jgi:23S rRNA (uridine2552-2'-O)-methyltransferase
MVASKWKNIVARVRWVSKGKAGQPKPTYGKKSKMPVLGKRKKKQGTQQFVVQDHYFFEAKKLGYRARSAFKLLEIQEKFKFIAPGMNVCDVASAPGSFLQVISRIIAPTDTLIGIDLQKITSLGKPNVHLLKADIFDYPTVSTFCLSKGITQFNVITSDIAPNTTGMKWVDQYRSIELNIAILKFADVFLLPRGNMILKVFVGEDIDELVAEVKSRFMSFTRFKPKACRDRSFEEYFVCMGKKEVLK